MSNFSNEVEAWHDFFMLAGTAAATLMGLLFVALSLRIDIRAQSKDSFMRATAGHSFMSYLCVLLFSLFFLIPNQDPTSLAVSVLLTSVFPLAVMARAIKRYRNVPEMKPESFRWRLLVPTGCFLTGVLVAIGIFLSEESAIGWFVAVIAFLLTVPTRNAWAMLAESNDDPRI